MANGTLWEYMVNISNATKFPTSKCLVPTRINYNGTFLSLHLNSYIYNAKFNYRLIYLLLFFVSELRNMHGWNRMSLFKVACNHTSFHQLKETKQKCNVNVWMILETALFKYYKYIE